MTTLLFGWTEEQWAHAKARHARLTGAELEPDSDGLVDLRLWWRQSGYAEPLSVRLEGVEPEEDRMWGMKAFNSVFGGAARARHGA